MIQKIIVVACLCLSTLTYANENQGTVKKGYDHIGHVGKMIRGQENDLLKINGTITKDQRVLCSYTVTNMIAEVGNSEQTKCTDAYTLRVQVGAYIGQINQYEINLYLHDQTDEYTGVYVKTVYIKGPTLY
ncbi:MAG: hypothetical protein R3A45_01885 [Bdellovibrionota bacterium]